MHILPQQNLFLEETPLETVDTVTELITKENPSFKPESMYCFITTCYKFFHIHYTFFIVLSNFPYENNFNSNYPTCIFFYKRISSYVQTLTGRKEKVFCLYLPMPFQTCRSVIYHSSNLKLLASTAVYFLVVLLLR